MTTNMTNPQKVDIPLTLEDPSLLPVYGTEEAAGADVRAFLSTPLLLMPLERKLIPTGLRFSIPKGYEIQVRPRSGLALKHGITVLNTPGTIDSDYRGELGIILINLSSEPFTVEPGMRIAQLILAPVIQASFKPSKTLETTARGAGGFGHTGTH